MEGGGLLFISRPFIHVIAGLAKGEISLTEFYRTAILLNALLSPFRGQETSDMRPSSSVLEGRMSLIAMESSEGYSPDLEDELQSSLHKHRLRAIAVPACSSRE